ncbi:unnamed protein product [Bemisia tabaci]|uniref:N-acetyltransferase domain-containing protein n=1 Tax=Bemisia tabaci TaxID=7038 RepID=A0A9P0CCZ0_BEMTA|nr:unnamed protein product [Bemisia tabaci]
MTQIALRWRNTDASKQIRIYTTSNKLESAGIVCVLKVMDARNHRISIHCIDKDTSALRHALLTTERINWSSPETTIFFTAFHENLLPIVQACLSHHNYKIIEYVNSLYKFPANLQAAKHVYKWAIPDQLTLCTCSCPPEVRLAPLKLESLELIKSNWFNHPDAAEYISTLIEHNPSLGVYSRTTGELRAWVLLSEFCALTMLHTVKKHRRKGYARLLVNTMCKTLLSEGLVVGAAILQGNIPSLKLFESLEFQSSQDSYVYTLAAPQLL